MGEKGAGIEQGSIWQGFNLMFFVPGVSRALGGAGENAILQCLKFCEKCFEGDKRS